MLRPSILALSLLAAFGVAGCSTIYRDVYSPKRNYFKPEPDRPSPSDVLPPTKPSQPDLPGGGQVPPTPPPAEQPPGLPGL